MQVFFQRKAWLTTLVIAVTLFVAHGAGAHHGWGWATDEEFEITGTITKVRLGNLTKTAQSLLKRQFGHLSNKLSGTNKMPAILRLSIVMPTA